MQFAEERGVNEVWIDKIVGRVEGYLREHAGDRASTGKQAELIRLKPEGKNKWNFPIGKIWEMGK